MKEFLKRGGWVFLALLFLVTALGVGVYSFIENTHSNSSNPNSNYLSCAKETTGTQKPGKNGKYEGAQLVSFTPVKHVSYLQCQDIKVGNGATATATSTISAVYTGAVAATGKIFQSSLDSGQPLTDQPLSQLIQGWQAGIPGMKAGGTRRLLIPAQYAYGAHPPPGIPVNADLVFDLTLLTVK